MEIQTVLLPARVKSERRKRKLSSHGQVVFASTTVCQCKNLDYKKPMFAIFTPTC